MGMLDQFVVRTLPLVPKPIVARLSRPYIAGSTLDAAVDCVKRLNDEGFSATIDLLGEFVTSFEQVEISFQGYVETLDAIVQHQLDSNISVKPTFFGLLLDEQRSAQVLERLLKEAVQRGNFMRLDMEDSPCTSATLQLYQTFREKYGQSVGVVLQSYLRRTLDDVAAVSQAQTSNFRLCKGIYVEPEELAFKGYQEIRDNFMASLNAMFEVGAYVGIATHDDYLVEQAEALVKERGLTKDQYEFQMLLGVRESVRNRLRDAGHRVRIYVPYGADWYGYSTRRLKENPALAGTFFKAIFFNR